MLPRIWKYLEERERAWRESFGNDISTPRMRRVAMRHFNWVDHGILRKGWTNFARVSDGVYRSNQPSPARLHSYHRRGIRSVLNLRGTSRYSYYLFERETCDRLGLGLADINLSATELPSLDTINRLETLFRTLPRPFVMHCKSGADRAGFASALYLLLIDDAPIEAAQRQLSLRFLHLKHTSKGILDFCLEEYRRHDAASPITFRNWLDNVYDPSDLKRRFDARRGRNRAG